MSDQNITVLRLDTFTRRVKKLFTEAEIEALAEYLAQHPEKGDIIPGMGGLRKLRWSRGNQGKRGGSRVIYYYHHPESLIVLFAAYAKRTQEDLDAAEKKMLRAVLVQFFEE